MKILSSENSSFVDIFFQNCERIGNSTAYTFLGSDGEREDNISYSQLLSESQSIAGYLQQFIKPGDRVLLFFHAGLDFVKAFYACLLAKVVAVPLYLPRNNRLYKSIGAIMKNADTNTVLTNAASSLFKKSDFYYENSPNIIDINTIDLTCLNGWKPERIDENDLAFLQYTSGSTGTPKGVIISHKNIVCNQKLIQKAFNQSSESTIIGWLPFYHDMGLVGNILHPAFLGARSILMAPQDFLQKPVRWLEAITKYSGTASGGPNFAFDLCVNKISDEDKVGLDLRSWDVAFSGSEPVRAETIRNFCRAFEKCGFKKTSFQPCYGMAESTLFISAEKYGSGANFKSFKRSELFINSSGVNIGSDTEVELVSCGMPDRDNLVIAGSNDEVLCENRAGEICIKGDSVTKGYWNDSLLTAKSFCELSLGSSAFFKTGDLGIISDGVLYVTGRLKDTIIINGVNYYPEDIEREISDGSLITACAAFSVEEQNKEHLVIIAEANGVANFNYTKAILEINRILFLEFQLTPLFVGFIRRGLLPRTSSGKIQRWECRNAYLKQGFTFLNDSNSVGHVQPVTESSDPQQTKQKIANIFKEIFNKDIGIDDDFFALGLDSIKAAQITIMINEELEKELSLDLLFEHNTIRSLAKAINREHSVSNNNKFLQDGEGVTLFDASSMQKSIWFHQHINPLTNAYNIPMCLKLDENVDILAFSKALNELVEKYEILRTFFLYEKETLKQNVTPYSPFSIEAIKYESEAEKYVICRQFYGEAFQMNKFPLWRARIIKNASLGNHFLFAIHHIISDGYSLALIGKEILSLYEQYKSSMYQGKVFQSKYQYRDYIINIKDRQYDAEEQYWKRQLSGNLNRLMLPGKKITSHGNISNSRQIIIPEVLYLDLLEVSKATNVSIYMVLLSAFVILLNKLTGQDDIIVGAPVLDRDLLHLKDMPGLFVNIIMLRIQADKEDRFSTLLQKVKRVVLDGLKNKSYPFEKVLDFAGTKDISKFGISSVFFNGLNFFNEEIIEQDIFPSDVGLDINFDINCYAIISKAGVQFRIDYKESLFDEPMIASFLSKYVQILENVAQNLEIKIKDVVTVTKHALPPVPADAYWYNPEANINDIFNVQFNRFKDNIAVCDDSVQLTYYEFNVITNKLSRYIKECINVTAPVCFLVEHNHNLAISVVAILKTRQAYVALDPEYPVDRLKLIVAETNSTVILTDNINAALAFELVKDKDLLIINIEELELSDKSSEYVKDEYVEGDLPAYILYTSGSSGSPKGVLQTHKNLLHFISNYTSAINITDRDNLTGFSSCSYDSFNNDLYGALLNGATYYPLSLKKKYNADELALWLEANNITIWHSIPTVFSFYAKYWEEQERTFSALRIVKMTGEVVNCNHFELFKTITSSDALFVVSLGSTESTLHCINTFGHADRIENLVLPVGFPVSRTEVHIVDDHFRKLDVLEVGKIVIESNFIAKGYLNLPELTDASFFIKGDKYYYISGDVGRRLLDGRVEWLYRDDFVVKRNGVRIDIGELEYYLMKFYKVSDAIVVEKVINDAAELVCYIVSEDIIEIDEIEFYLKKCVPAAYLPTRYIRIDSIPRTSNGKVDRVSIKNWNIVSFIAKELIKAQTPTEEILLSVWADILNETVDSVSANFFQIGGNSIKAMQLANKLSKEFGIEIHLRVIFERPTIQSLAQYIDIVIWQNCHDSVLSEGKYDEFVI